MKTITATKPILKIDDTGLMRSTATCDAGALYVYWEIDRLALEEDAECEICGKMVDCGWHCLDGGAIYCDDCIINIENAGEYIRELERWKAAYERTNRLLTKELASIKRSRDYYRKSNDRLLYAQTVDHMQDAG